MSQGEGTPSVLTVCGATHLGKVRDGNEDAFVVCELERGQPATPTRPTQLSAAAPGVLLMVCDGMGGAAAGEVAARVACETVCRLLHHRRGPEAAADLAAAIVGANAAIRDEAQRHVEKRGMGTTSTAALVREGRLLVAQVGDSRAYVSRAGVLHQLTRDQSLAMAMIEAGQLSPAQLKSFPHANVILQALGTQETVEPALTELALEPQDTLLLCSDGLHGPVARSEIAAILGAEADLAERAAALIRAALDAGATDNVTALVAQWSGPRPQ